MKVLRTKALDYYTCTLAFTQKKLKKNTSKKIFKFDISFSATTPRAAVGYY